MSIFNRRKFVLKNASALGNNISNKLLKYSYAIKLSTFLKKHSHAPKFTQRFLMYEHIINTELIKDKAIQYFEFGVFKGDSIKFWASKNQHPSSTFYGFDSFEGLPEDWQPGLSKGHFETGGNTPVTNDNRIQFVKGWFNKTLSGFIKSTPLTGEQIVIHMDADLFSSTYYVLNNLYFNKYIQEGTILIFDEVIVASIADTEFRAFYDFMEVMGIEYEVLGIAHFEMGIKITKI